jgi:hypothetical protein
MPGIFISYRRDDTAGHAGRLFDRLGERFGKDRVFMDVVGIEPGVDFVEAIEKAVGACALALVVIGHEWARFTDDRGRRRLDDPKDFVRLEIASALNRNLWVIPVLVEGAPMPTADVLPEDIKPLARRNAAELRDTRWEADFNDLTRELEKILTSAVSPVEPVSRRTAAEATGPKTEPRPERKLTLWAGIALGALIILGLAWFLQPRPVPPVVPDVVGKPFHEARQAIERAGLKVGEIAREPVAGTSPGTVVSQEPSGGTRLSREPRAAKNGTVALTIAEEPLPSPAAGVEVPDLVGMGLELALEKIGRAGLSVGSREGKPSGDIPPNQVLSQMPQRGMRVDRGTPVNLVFALRPVVSEDCVAFNPAAATITKIDDRWKIVDGSHRLFDFATSETKATRSLEIIRHYGMNQSCFVGGPRSAFSYLLVSGSAPAGALAGEDCISFNPNNLEVTEIGGRWGIVEGNHRLFDFGGNRAEAEQAAGVIRKYGFTRNCYVGRPGPSFTYLRR